jgi:ankyrin repeat protein
MKITFINHFKKLVYLIVLIGFNVSFAGSFEDFFQAVKRDDAQEIQQLLVRGFDANTLDPKGQSGLSIALREPSLKVAQTLIDWPKTNLNAVSAQGESPLMLASLKGQLDLVEKMIRKGADVNKTGWAPLHYAATTGQVKVISLLLENHAYIDAESPNGSTPLMMASMYGTPAAVKLLLEEGADPLLRNQQGLTALQFAQRASRPDSAELLVNGAKGTRAQRPPGKW